MADTATLDAVPQGFVPQVDESIPQGFVAVAPVASPTQNVPRATSSVDAIPEGFVPMTTPPAGANPAPISPAIPAKPEAQDHPVPQGFTPHNKQDDFFTMLDADARANNPMLDKEGADRASAFMQGAGKGLAGIIPKDKHLIEQHPVISAIGEGMGQLAGLATIGAGVGGMATKAVASTVAKEGLSLLPYIQTAAKIGTGAATFGIKSALDKLSQFFQGKPNTMSDVADVAKATAGGAMFGAADSVAAPIARITAQGLVGVGAAKLQGADNLNAAIGGVVNMLFGFMNHADLGIQYKEQAVSQVHQDLSLKLNQLGVPLKQAMADADNYVYGSAIKATGIVDPHAAMREVLKNPANNLEYFEALDNHIKNYSANVPKSLTDQVVPPAPVTPRIPGSVSEVHPSEQPINLPAEPSVIKPPETISPVSGQFSNPNDPHMLEYLSQYLPAKVVAGLTPDARLGLANGPWQDLRDMASQQTGKPGSGIKGPEYYNNLMLAGKISPSNPGPVALSIPANIPPVAPASAPVPTQEIPNGNVNQPATVQTVVPFDQALTSAKRAAAVGSIPESHIETAISLGQIDGAGQPSVPGSVVHGFAKPEQVVDFVKNLNPNQGSVVRLGFDDKTNQWIAYVKPPGTLAENHQTAVQNTRDAVMAGHAKPSDAVNALKMAKDAVDNPIPMGAAVQSFNSLPELETFVKNNPKTVRVGMDDSGKFVAQISHEAPAKSGLNPITIEHFNQQQMPLKTSELKVEPELIKKVNALQDILGKQIKISSGYRTPAYNQLLKKQGYNVAEKSLHLSGRAADIPVSKDLTHQEIVDAAHKVGLDVEHLSLTPKHVHVELPTPNTPTFKLQPRKGSLSSESGEAIIPGVDAAAENIKNGIDYVKRTSEMTPIAGDLNHQLNTLRTQNKADEIRAVQLLEKVKIDPADAEAIYHHIENSKEPLTPEQEKFYQENVKPLLDANNELFSKLRNDGIPVDGEGHVSRFVADKGGIIDRLKAGAKGVAQGSLLNQSTGSFKHRVMKALTDSSGNRIVVAIKNGQVTAFKNGQLQDLGPLKRNLPDKVTEHFDAHVMQKLEALAKSLGVTHSRQIKLKAWSKLGLSYPGMKYVETKAASPEGVLLHELGHQIDDMFNLQDKFVNPKVKDFKGQEAKDVSAIKKEIRALVDLKFEGGDAAPSFKSYVRKGEEKIAGMFEALVTAPDRFKEVAPTLYKKFTEYLASEPKLKPILDIKRSMVIGSRTTGESPNEPGTFTDKNGKDYSIGEATTKEIEANTDLKYHKNALLNELITYNSLKKIDRAVQFLEKFKESPEFDKIGMKFGTSNIPDGWRAVNMPQFRGYAFEPRIADTLDHFYKQLKSSDESGQILSKINDFLTTSIFFNPLIHVPNILNHWAVNRGVTGLSPTSYMTLIKTSGRAINAVIHQNDDYLQMLDHGANMLYFDTTGKRLSDLMLQKMGEELSKDQELAKNIAKTLGYINPANLIKALYSFSSRVTWATNDLATMQAVYEEMAHGKTIDDAIKDVAKHIPDYRVPARVLDSKVLADIMQNRQITMFTRYHYGALRSYGAMLRSLKDGDLKDKASSVDKLAMLGLITLVIYPMLDALAKKMTGDKNVMVRRAGASTVPFNVYRLTKGKIDFADFVFSILPPSPMLKFGTEEVLNRDLHTGQKIRNPGTEGQDVLKNAANAVSPLNYYQRIQSGQMSPTKFGEGLLGVSSSKTMDMTDAQTLASKLNSQRYGDKPMSDQDRKHYQAKQELLAQAKDKGVGVLDKALAEGTINKRTHNELATQMNQTPLQHSIHSMTISDAMMVADKASPSELKEIMPMVQKKYFNALNRASGDDREYIKNLYTDFLKRHKMSAPKQDTVL